MENKAELMEPEVSNKIVEFDEFELKLDKYLSEYKGMVYDLTDPEQEVLAKQHHKEVRKTVNNLESARKTKKAAAQAEVKLIDGEGKRIRDKLNSLCTDISDQQEAYAQIAILEDAKLHSMITEIEMLCNFDQGGNNDLEILSVRLESANAVTVDNKFKSREPDGHMAKAKTIQALEGMIALAEKVEAQRMTDELAAKKAQEEREEQIRKDAAAEAEQEKERVIEKAKADKMARELQAAADAEQADEDKKNAELKAKADAKAAKVKADKDKQAAIKAEQAKAAKLASDKIEADKKETARIQKIADDEAAALLAKQNNQQHRAKIHKEAKTSLMTLGLMIDDDTATVIVKAIIQGSIKNITINY